MIETSNIAIWRRIAQISGIFAIIISGLLIVNYIQYNRIDPVETQAINSLITRLNENPDDFALREQVRELDLLSRKAYFTNRWQVRTGGYLLLISIGVLIVSMQIIKSGTGKEVSLDEKGSSFTQNRLSQKWITIAGSIVFTIALLSAYLTHDSLGELPVIIEKSSEIVEQPKVVPDSPQENISETPEQNIVIDESTEQETEVATTPEVSQETDKQIAKITEPDEVKKEPAHTKDEVIATNKLPDYNELINNHTTFRGPLGDGISFEKNVPEQWNGETGENILWKTKIPLHGYNSPIVWKNKVFLTGANSEKREVYCLDSESGSIIWTYDVTGIPGSPANSPKTTDDTGLAAPTATTNGESVFAIFGNGDLVALDMDGNKIWNRNMGDPDNHYGYSSSLLIYNNILIVQYDTKKAQRILGFDISTGKEVWETDRNVKISWASPVLINYNKNPQVILTADPGVQSYDPTTGKELWTVDCVYGEVGPSIAYADNVVYATNEYATLAAIKLGETPEILWESDYYLSDVPSPVAKDGLLYLATSYGAVVCHDALTGDMYWEQEFDNGFYSSPILVDNKIYLIDMDGITHIFSTGKQYNHIADCILGENSMTTPAFKDGKIFIRGNDHLYCIGRE